MNRTLHNIVAIVLTSILGGCVGSEITPVSGARMAPRPKGCQLAEFPSTTPTYPWDDVATVRAHCHYTKGRSACVEQLRDAACEAGGDTIYGYKEGQDRGSTIIVATIARRTNPETAVKTTAAPCTSANSDGCDPPCSPGYRCDGGKCTALCNPQCAAGMVCAPDRTCQPVAEPSR